jgi:hypothetical protein
MSVICSEPILSVVTWATEDSVAAVWMNRVQNNAKIVSCSARTSRCLEVTFYMTMAVF